MRDLVAHRQIWRGEVQFETRAAARQPMLIRADPVYAAPDRVRGLVVLLTDNTEQRAASNARRRFQEGLRDGQGLASIPIGGKSDLVYRDIMSTAVENAQLAALEITDRADAEKMPELLESVRVSVARTAEVLEHLIWHTRLRSDT